MFKLDLKPLAPRLLQNRETQIDYLKYTQEQAHILWEILLVYLRDTCPNAINLSAKRVAVTPKNKVKKVRFVEPLTSSSNIKQAESSTTSNSNTPVLSPIGLKCSTSNFGSRPMTIKGMIGSHEHQHSLLNANSKPIYATCKKSMFESVHDMCLLDFVENVNICAKSAKKHKKQNIWKPTGHVFTEVGLKWKPTGKFFIIVGNSCPLTRITSANVVPPKKTTSHSVETQKPELKVYTRKPKNVKNVGSSKNAKIVESKKANHSEPNHTWGSNDTDILSSSSLVITGKSKKSSHQPKAEDTNQEKLYLLHMDLCGLMRLASINRKRYILVIADDYSRFNWVRFLRTKDEALEVIIKCIKNIQVRLNATICNVRTDNGTEFVNQILREFYENVGISHQTFVARTPQ
ncbi:retrovirus-related pol polyprotein from transposon TNT 1-94 [Tanacetum coccineum]